MSRLWQRSDPISDDNDMIPIVEILLYRPLCTNQIVSFLHKPRVSWVFILKFWSLVNNVGCWRFLVVAALKELWMPKLQFPSNSVSPKIHVGDERDSKFPWACLKWHANFQLTFQNSNLGSSPFNKTKKGNKLKWWTTQILPRLLLYSRPSVESFHFQK